MKRSRFKGCFCSKEIKGCHSQEFLLGIFRILSSYVKKGNALCDNDTYVEDPRLQASGMTALCNGAFTLIELLVVVLIIGILAAVAVPQYQKAVGKSRLVQLITVGTALKQAEELYYLANGQYTGNLNELDIDFDEANISISTPAPEGTQNVPSILSVEDTRLAGISILFGMKNSGNSVWNDARACYASKENTQADKLCQLVTGRSTFSMTDSGYNKYFF